MSDLYIMFGEAYDSKTPFELRQRIEAISNRFNLRLDQVIEWYDDYIDSDLFYAERGF